MRKRKGERCRMLEIERILRKEIGEIEFDTVEELYERKEEIREKYGKLSGDIKRIYKWYYFYQLCLLDYELKSLMWDYICGIGDVELPLRLSYMNFKRKKEKYHLKYMLEEQKKKEI